MRFGKGLAALVCGGVAWGLSASASGLALTGGVFPSSFSNTFGGTLGPVDIVAIPDGPAISSGVGSGGVINFLDPIPVVRIQYDLLNRVGNVPIFEFTVPYEAGVSVVGATNPGQYIDSGGASGSWAGSNSATIFDSGFGTYTSDRTLFGSDWEIDFASDSITWRYMESGGFLPDTATGRTDLGSALPTFAIAFAAGTELGVMTAEVRGDDIFGAPVVSSSGRTLTGVVPEPGTLVLGLCGVGLLAGRRRVHSN